MQILLCFILISVCVAQRDDDSNERNRFMPFVAAAYSFYPDVCLSNIQQHWNPFNAMNESLTIYRQSPFNCNSADGDPCAGYIAVDKTDDVDYGFIILAFRGTSNYDQNFAQDWANYNEMVPFIAGGKVNKHFMDAFNEIWTKGGMKDDVYTLKNKYPAYRVHVVGHSLGGAIASIAAATIVSTGIAPANRVMLFTFGQPRTGDKDYANVFVTLKINSTRIVHKGDSVSRFPTDATYDHHIQEFWYPNDMTDIDPFYQCNSTDGEDSKCSNSYGGALNFDDHKFYYGREFGQYGINGCADLAEKKIKKISVIKKVFRYELSKLCKNIIC